VPEALSSLQERSAVEDSASDDPVLLAQSAELLEKIKRWAAGSAERGLRVNTEKPKLMRCE
jgi:hypothetical protein